MVRVEGLRGESFPGRVTWVSPEIDRRTRTLVARVELENPEGLLRAHMFGRAEIVKTRDSNSLAVPLYAVISRNDVNFVYVVNDSHAVRREVELGILDGWKIQITRGLKPGDRVIVVGHRDVNDGQEVMAVREVTDPAEILR